MHLYVQGINQHLSETLRALAVQRVNKRSNGLQCQCFVWSRHNFLTQGINQHLLERCRRRQCSA